MSNVRLTTGWLRNDFQDFGTHRENDPPFSWVERDRKTGGYVRRTKARYYIHKGVDIGNGDGQSYTVRSLVRGIVRQAAKSDGFWPFVLVVEDLDNLGHYHRYGHLEVALGDADLKVGDPVIPGTPLGKTASTAYLRAHTPGSTMHAHLHYEITSRTPPDPSLWPDTYHDPLLFIRDGVYSPMDGRRHITRHLPEEIG